MAESLRKRIEEELRSVELELTIDIPKELRRAVALGDLRENSEYQTALQRQEFLKARSSELRKRLTDLSMIDLTRVPRDKIGYGSIVILYDADSGDEIEYRLVTSEEADADKGLISTVSPIGRGLMGKQAGDEVTVRTPGGVRNFEVRALKTLHDVEAAG